MLVAFDFYKAISTASKEIKPPISKELEFYLYNLFITPTLTSEPVAILLYKTIDSPYEEKVKIFKTIGDSNLSLVGLFPQSLKHKPVSADYYISTGAISYGQLSKLSWSNKRDQASAYLYEELADCFLACTQIMKDAVGHLSVPTNVVGFNREIREKTGNSGTVG